MTTYKLNADTAKQGDKGSTQYIDTTGEYTGIFTVAKQITARSGTDGIEFTFQSDDGQVARYLTIYTTKADGTEVFGMGMLHALMTCLKVREIKSETITVEEWDNNARVKVPVDIENFTALCNKHVGVLLQKEYYTANTGDTKSKMTIAGFFDAASRLTATEILEKVKEPKSLDVKLRGLKDKGTPGPVSSDHGFSDPAVKSQVAAASVDDLDSDIPW